jgi:hypothetical protein
MSKWIEDEQSVGLTASSNLPKPPYWIEHPVLIA